jgi:hypothetical protein
MRGLRSEPALVAIARQQRRELTIARQLISDAPTLLKDISAATMTFRRKPSSYTHRTQAAAIPLSPTIGRSGTYIAKI